MNYVSIDDRDVGRRSYQGRANYNGNRGRSFQEESNQHYRDEHRRSRSCDDNRNNRNSVTFDNNAIEVQESQSRDRPNQSDNRTEEISPDLNGLRQ